MNDLTKYRSCNKFSNVKIRPLNVPGISEVEDIWCGDTGFPDAVQSGDDRLLRDGTVETNTQKWQGSIDSIENFLDSIKQQTGRGLEIQVSQSSVVSQFENCMLLRNTIVGSNMVCDKRESSLSRIYDLETFLWSIEKSKRDGLEIQVTGIEIENYRKILSALNNSVGD